MFKSLVAAVFVVMFVAPASAQQVINTFGPWTIAIFPERGICSAHKIETINEKEAVVQYIAVGQQFTLQVKDPRFDYNVGEEFGTVIETDDQNQYIRMQVMQTMDGKVFLSSEDDVEKGIDLFVQLAQADEMTLRHRDATYTYTLEQSNTVAASLINCNEATVK